ncbi:MAG: DNA alkylation repair protein, partial [Bacteroidota bacterium]
MPELLKDRYSEAFVQRLATGLQAAYPPFDQKAFTASVFDATWAKRELRDRMRHFSHCLHRAIPEPYPQQLAVFKKVVWEGQELELMFFPDFVECYGMDDLETSLSALEYLTPFASAEFAIRPFLMKYPEAVLQQMIAWSRSPNLDVRRLASEGCRPRLPW